MSVAPGAQRYTGAVVVAWAGWLVACLDEPSGRLVGPQGTAPVLSTSVSGTPWAKIYGSSLGVSGAQVVRLTPDGAFLVAGWTRSFGAGLNDFWVLKLDGSGDTLWQRTYGGGGDEAVENIEVTPDGGAIMVGLTTSFGAAHEPWVLKIDAQGNVQWEHTYRTTGRDWGFSIQPTRDGGYILAGGTDLGWPTRCCREAGQLIKLASDGSIEWQHTFDALQSENFRSAQQTADGGFIVAGYTGPHGLPHNDGWLLKLDATGSIEWQETFGGNAQEELHGVAQTADGGYVLAGRTTSFGAGAGDAWVLRLTSAGRVVWAKAFGGASAEDGAFDVQSTLDGGFVVAGWTGSFATTGIDSWILKLNGDGSIAWQKVYDSGSQEDIARSIREIPGGGYIVATGGSPAASHFTVLRLDQNGTIASTCPASMGANTSGVTASVSEPAPAASGTSAISTALATTRNAVSTTTSATVQTVCTRSTNQAPTAVACVAALPGITSLDPSPTSCIRSAKVTAGYIAPTAFPPTIVVRGNTSSDPDGDVLVLSWTDGVNGVALGTGAQLDGRALLGPGTHTVVLKADDQRGGIAFDQVTIEVPELVVLVHGWHGDSTTATFGQMGNLLGEDFTVLAYDYSSMSSCTTSELIETIATDFRNFLGNRVLARNAAYQGHINVLAHSMGGLVTRAYMVGLAGPYRHDLHRVLMAGTPNFGTVRAHFAKLFSCRIKVPRQEKEMEFSDEFIWKLNDTWNTVFAGTTEAASVMSIAGQVNLKCRTGDDDGVVNLWSATLSGFEGPSGYAPYAHAVSSDVNACNTAGLLVYAPDKGHRVYQAAKQFFTDGTLYFDVEDPNPPDDPLEDNIEDGLALIRFTDTEQNRLPLASCVWGRDCQVRLESRDGDVFSCTNAGCFLNGAFGLLTLTNVPTTLRPGELPFELYCVSQAQLGKYTLAEPTFLDIWPRRPVMATIKLKLGVSRQKRCVFP